MMSDVHDDNTRSTMFLMPLIMSEMMLMMLLKMMLMMISKMMLRMMRPELRVFPVPKAPSTFSPLSTCFPISNSIKSSSATFSASPVLQLASSSPVLQSASSSKPKSASSVAAVSAPFCDQHHHHHHQCILYLYINSFMMINCQ